MSHQRIPRVSEDAAGVIRSDGAPTKYRAAHQIASNPPMGHLPAPPWVFSLPFRWVTSIFPDKMQIEASQKVEGRFNQPMVTSANDLNHEPWKAFHAREQRSLEIKRDAVLQTAAKLFLEMGYRKTSMRLLAARLNITKPALYYYFRNKEELLVECYRAGIDSIEGALKGAPSYEGKGLEKVHSYIRSYVTAIVTFDFGRCVAMLDESELSEQTRRHVRNLKRRIDAAIRGYIEEGIEDGSVAPCNPKMASFAIAGAINWIGTWYRPGGGLGAEEIVSEFTRLLTAGLQQCPPNSVSTVAASSASKGHLPAEK